MRKKITFRVGDFGAIVVLAIVLTGIGGWIANIVKLIDSDFARMSGLSVMRVIGVFVAPLGAVLGFL